MNRKPVSSKVLLGLIAAGLVLPTAICIVLGLAALLGEMRDASGAAVLGYVALGGGIVWIVVLIGLIFVLAINALARSDDPDQ